MATYYWVDNGVNVGWSLTSGGAPAGISDPTDLDDIIFNTNSGSYYANSTLFARSCTIAANTNIQLVGSFYLAGSFINSSTLANVEALLIYMGGRTATWTVSSPTRIGTVILSRYNDGTATIYSPTYNLGSVLNTGLLENQGVNFNTQNFAITAGSIYINASFLPAATTVNLGSSVITVDIFDINANPVDFRITINLGTSKINSFDTDIFLSTHVTTTASAGQAFTSTNNCNIETSSANLAIATGTITAETFDLTVIGSTSTTTVGAILITGNYLDIYVDSTGTTTVGTINGNTAAPPAISIFATGTATLNIGAIGGVVANSINYVNIQHGTAININGVVRITGTLEIESYLLDTAIATITGAITAGSIEVNSGAVTRFNSTTTTTIGDVYINGDTRFSGALVVASNLTLYTSATISSTVSVGDTIMIDNQSLVTFPAAVTAAFVEIYSPTTFTTGTHNISDSFQWYAGNLSLGSSVLVVKRYLNFSGNDTFTRGTSTVRVGGYVGSPDYLGRTFGSIVSQNTASFNILQLLGDVILVGSSITAVTLSRTGNANNFGETIFTDTVTVSGTANGSLTISGNSLINRMFVRSAISGVPVVIRTNPTGLRAVSNVDFKDITATDFPAISQIPSVWTGTSLGNRLGNSGISFTTAVTRFARGSGEWNSTTIWSTVSGGTSGASVPLPQDTVIINSLSGTGVINTGNVRVLGANVSIQTGYTGTLNFNSNVASNGVIPSVGVYGQLIVQPTNVTITATGGTAIEFYNRTIPLTLDYGNNSTIINTVVDIETNTITLAQPLGTTVNRTNTLTIDSGTVNTAGYDLHLASINGSIIGTNASTIALNNSNVYVYNGNLTCYQLATNTSNVYAMNLAKIQAEAGSFYNLYISNTLQSIETVFNAAVGNLISSNNPSMPSTANFKFKNQSGFAEVTGKLRIQNNIDLGSIAARVTFDDVTIYNDSTNTIQTQYAAYYNCTAAGSYSGVKLTGFGLADMGENLNIEFPSVIRAIAFSNVSARSYTLPDDFTGSAMLIAIGGGGAGGNAGGAAAGGGGGGAYARSEIISLTKGQTIYVSSTQSVAGRSTLGVGSRGNTVWINTQSNEQPATVLQGVSASGGGGGGPPTFDIDNVSSGVGGSSAIGAYTFSGRNGGSASTISQRGSGGGGAPGWTSGSNARSGNGSQGGAGGSLEFVTAAFGGSNATVTTNGTAGSSGTAGVAQGGGGGGGGFFGSTTKIGTYTRSTPSQTLTINSVNHGLVNGDRYSHTVTTTQTGTYSRSIGNVVITVTRTSHGLSVNDTVYLDFTSGSATDGYYTINQIVSSSQFRVNSALASGTSGGVRILPFPPTSTHTITVINDNQYTITTISTGPMTGTASVPVISSLSNGSAGGNGSNLNQYQLNYVNSGTFIGGTALIGPGGGGGGGGAGSNFPGFNGSGGAGGQGGIGAGGGGAGRTSTTPVVSGAGGPGLAVILYAYGKPSQFSTIIGQL